MGIYFCRKCNLCLSIVLSNNKCYFVQSAWKQARVSDHFHTETKKETAYTCQAVSLFRYFIVLVR